MEAACRSQYYWRTSVLFSYFHGGYWNCMANILCKRGNNLCSWLSNGLKDSGTRQYRRIIFRNHFLNFVKAVFLLWSPEITTNPYRLSTLDLGSGVIFCNMIGGGIMIFYISWSSLAFANSIIAIKKRHSGANWFILSLMIGPKLF